MNYLQPSNIDSRGSFRSNSFSVARPQTSQSHEYPVYSPIPSHQPQSLQSQPSLESSHSLPSYSPSLLLQPSPAQLPAQVPSSQLVPPSQTLSRSHSQSSPRAPPVMVNSTGAQATQALAQATGESPTSLVKHKQPAEIRGATGQLPLSGQQSVKESSQPQALRLNTQPSPSLAAQISTASGLEGEIKKEIPDAASLTTVLPKNHISNEKQYHGKSLRSVQLFENQPQPVEHIEKNPTVKAQIFETFKPVRPPVKLSIHADSCYNFLNKRRYTQSVTTHTPLEYFFHRESIGQFKVAQIISHLQPALRPETFPYIRRTKEYLLVLDIDETLVHSELTVEQDRQKYSAQGKEFDKTIEFKNPNGTVDIYGVRYRPFLQEFLERMSRLFDIAVYTASAKEYADAVVQHIDPDNKYICARFYRDHCVRVNGMNIKNMNIFDGHKAMIVDNLIYSYAYHMSQGIPICPFVDDAMDVELKDLAEILENIDSFNSLDELVEDLLGLQEFYDNLYTQSQHGGHDNDLQPHRWYSSKNQDRTAGGTFMSTVL